jgi:hypothetical protein
MKDLFILIFVSIVSLTGAMLALVATIIVASVLFVFGLFFKSLPYVIAGLILLTLWHFFVNPLI